MTTRDLIGWAASKSTCPEALEWLRGRPQDEPMETVWAQCARGDWMLWWAGNAGIPRPLLVSGACATARLALPYAGELQEVTERCLEVTDAWTRGEATLEEVREAAGAAHAVATFDTDDAFYWAADAAYAAASATFDAYVSFSAACVAADAAAYASDTADRKAMQARCADVVRATIPWESVAEAMQASN